MSLLLRRQELTPGFAVFRKVRGLIIESVLHLFACVLGHPRCDVGVTSDSLFLSPPRSCSGEARPDRDNKEKICFMLSIVRAQQHRWG